ncbi:MAG: hypothetical protein U0175_16285 [Caldilineaceae bacterium]
MLAQQWVVEEATTLPGFIGAFFHGSITWLEDDAVLSLSSDVDIMVVLSGEMPAVKLGKFRHQGVLLEVSYLAADEISSAEQVLGTFYLAGSLRTATPIADPTGKLKAIQQVVAQEFAKPQWVRARCQQAGDKILSNLQSIETYTQFHDQVSAWLFGTSLTTIVLLLAGLKNPTVRKRYVAVKELLMEHGYGDFYEELLDLLGCRQISQERCRAHLAALTEVFDVAKSVVKTPIFFASDISDDARPIAIDGSRNLIDNGLQREAIFWLVATYARCQKVLAQDTPRHVFEQFDLPFRALLADLGIQTLDDILARRERVKGFLPRLWDVAETLIKANPVL